jgi:outer membrane lipase/esterase
MACATASSAPPLPAVPLESGAFMKFRLFSMRKGLVTLAGWAVLAGLASCGGGGQVEPFEPNRILAFGDELSVIQADGRKYTVNAFRITDSTTTPPTESTTEVDCARNPIWIQSVAAAFGLVFDRCPGTATTTSGQVMAQAGHKVADIAAQAAAVQGAALNENDLALVMVGMNDILELYGNYPTSSRDALLAEARNRGTALGERVNALARSGPAVVVLTVPDLGLTPFARAQNTSTSDPTRSALLSDLTAAFNNRMSVTLINDGRLIGLVYADVESQNMVRFPSSFGLSNVVDAACVTTVTSPNCTTATLVTGATSANYLWADGLFLGPTGQARLGAVAASRARNNPF